MISRRTLSTLLFSLVLGLTSTLIARAGIESSELPSADRSPSDAKSPEVATVRQIPFVPNQPAAAEAPKAEKPAKIAEANATDSEPPVDDPRREIIGLQKLGVSLTERGDWDAGEIAFRQILASLRANKKDIENALLGLARVYRRKGSLTKAAAVYERYLKDYPNAVAVPDALLELGRTQRALGADQLALSHFYNVINSTLKLTSDNSEHYQVLAKTAQFEIAETHFQEGNFAEANKFYSRLQLLDLAPADRARAHFKSAEALYRGKDYEAAIKKINSYLVEWTDDENVPEARYLLSLSLRALGRKQEALDATLALLRTEQSVKDPKRWAYWQRKTGNQLANDFFQSGDTMNALMIYQGLESLSKEPEWRFPVTYQVALCYERMRLYDRAATAYQSIIDGVKSPAKKPSDAPTTAGPDAPKANPELSELSRMAAWRLGQLNWNTQTEKQLAAVFTTPNDTMPKSAPDAHAPAPNIDSNVASDPTPAPGNEHSGNAAKTSASL
ncbi:MAG TPA: tetratricopeptide repeat protein [Lacunisphaera sp.]|jgi:TolA-binding protein